MTEQTVAEDAPQRARRLWPWITGGVVLIAVVVVAIVVPLALARPSLQDIASDCGGALNGLQVDDTGLTVDMSGGTSGLMCVLRKLVSDKAEQYAVTIALDKGSAASFTFDGRQVTVGAFGSGGQYVLFGN
ncbi:hypothetical protein [Microbacterium sp. KR10-403]|uniref:hypothetical protein n=1 Tax=Microbacterium sp. KR10-403 TaxID=3158581 RepID=UPI0032E4C838